MMHWKHEEADGCSAKFSKWGWVCTMEFARLLRNCEYSSVCKSPCKPHGGAVRGEMQHISCFVPLLLPPSTVLVLLSAWRQHDCVLRTFSTVLALAVDVECTRTNTSTRTLVRTRIYIDGMTFEFQFARLQSSVFGLRSWVGNPVVLTRTSS